MKCDDVDAVQQTLHRAVQRLREARISYAVVGGLAVQAHGHRRRIGNVDVLLTPGGFEAFRKRFGLEYYDRVPGRNRRFVDRVSRIMVVVHLTGHHPGIDQSSPITYPDPAQASEEMDGIRVVNLRTLIEVKIAARRFCDLADVVGLVRRNNLTASFANCLHPSF